MWLKIRAGSVLVCGHPAHFYSSRRSLPAVSLADFAVREIIITKGLKPLPLTTTCKKV